MDADRRRQERLGLAIPVRVQGYLPGGETWEEMSTTTDVSTRGACFPLNHPLQLGHVLLLTMAMPRRLRGHDTHDSTYRVFSLVRFVQHRGERPRVGVMFFGKYPPRGFYQHPEGRYLLPGDPMAQATGGVEASRSHGSVADQPSAPGLATASTGPVSPEPAAPLPSAPPAGTAAPSEAASASQAGPPPGSPPSTEPASDRRGATRSDVYVNFVLQLTDAQGSVLQQELTVADNISRGGARVMTTLPFQVGDVLLLQEAGGVFATRAEVRAVTRLQPAFERLHLRFLDEQAPDRLLR